MIFRQPTNKVLTGSAGPFAPPLPLAANQHRDYYELVRLIRVDAKVQWKCLQGKGGNWVGVCDPLKLTVQAETWAELMEDISLTLDAMLKDLLSSNELERFLKDRGWTLTGAIPTRPEGVRFDVPFFPAMMGNDPSQQLHQ